jgi:hypothetical protein
MTLLGLREFNAYLLLGLWAVSLIDVHSQASKINHRAPSAKETLVGILVVVLVCCVCAGLGAAVYWLWNEGDQLLNLTALAYLQSSPSCHCPSLDQISPLVINQRVCLTGRAWNILYTSTSQSPPRFMFRERGPTTNSLGSPYITVFLPISIPSTLRENDSVAVVGTYRGSKRIDIETPNDLSLCSPP